MNKVDSFVNALREYIKTISQPPMAEITTKQAIIRHIIRTCNISKREKTENNNDENVGVPNITCKKP